MNKINILFIKRTDINLSVLIFFIKKEAINMRLSEHFDSSEFDCHGGSYCNCGGQGEKMNSEFIKRLEQLRYNIGGLSLSINSGYRCYE